MNQKFDSREKLIHIEKNNLRFSERKRLMVKCSDKTRRAREKSSCRLCICKCENLDSEKFTFYTFIA